MQANAGLVVLEYLHQKYEKLGFTYEPSIHVSLGKKSFRKE